MKVRLEIVIDGEFAEMSDNMISDVNLDFRNLIESGQGQDILADIGDANGDKLISVSLHRVSD